MKRNIWIAVLGAVWAGQVHATEVLARAGRSEISVEEIRALAQTLPAQDQVALAKDPALLSQLVRASLTKKTLLADLAARKFDQQPAVKAQLDRARDQVLMELYLDSVSKPPDAYPSDAEVAAAYEANKSSFQVARQFRVAQIFVAVPKGADQAAEEKAKKKLDEVVKKVKAKGADFGAVAKTDSEDGSAAQGGEIGWLTEAQLLPGIRGTVTSMGKDAIAEPVRLDDGWHVLKLLDLRPAGARPLAEVRESLVTQLRAAKSRELRQAYLAKLLEQNPPAINELALSKVLEKAK